MGGGYFTWILDGGNNNNNSNNSRYPGVNFLNIQLDIVGFLAVLGEGAVLANAQVASLSRITFIPRLMPAPQALIRPSRPEKLSAHFGYATSIHSGNIRHNINHVGHILVDAEGYKEYSVRCVKIDRKEIHELHKRETKSHEDTLTANTWGPLTLVAFTGFAFSVIIFAIAVWQHDGMAMLADILLSLLSTVVGFATKWKLTLPKRKNKSSFTPPGDVAIRYTKGSFLLVQCDEDVARELYFAPENIDYLVESSWKYRIISLVGTVMLMFGVIFLGNAQTPLQLAFAGAYIIMNALYWTVAALPNRVHWDTSCFRVVDQCIELGSGDNEDEFDNKGLRRTLPKQLGKSYKAFVDRNDTFTEALWKAIVVTKKVEWIKRSAAAPDTPAWNDWLDKAKKKSRESSYRVETIDGKEVTVWELPDWNPVKALNECLMTYSTMQEKPAKPDTPSAVTLTRPGADKNV